MFIINKLDKLAAENALQQIHSIYNIISYIIEKAEKDRFEVFE